MLFQAIALSKIELGYSREILSNFFSEEETCHQSCNAFSIPYPAKS